jgi:ABC-2 type transport system ATP-binding protein
VRGNVEDVVPVIQHIPGVITIRIQPGDMLECESIPNQDVRPDVARAIINAGFDLLELRLENLSLEEIFLQLTRDEPPTPDSKPLMTQPYDENLMVKEGN